MRPHCDYVAILIIHNCLVSSRFETDTRSPILSPPNLDWRMADEVKRGFQWLRRQTKS